MRISATLILATCVFTQSAVHAQQLTWKPITPGDLNATSSVEQNADAEALFWDIYIDQTESKTTVSHYIRLKVLTDRGAETQGRVDLPFSGKDSVKDISARTIQSDGSIKDVEPSSIFERTIVKGKKVRIQAKSFALPAISPGTLIEYRWTEVLQGIDPYRLPLYIQRDFPIRLVQYSIKPLELKNVYAPLQIVGFNCAPTPLTTDAHGRRLTSVRNIPAFQAEPNMPPDTAVRSWLLLFYEFPTFWTAYGNLIYESTKERMKVTDEVRRTANELLRGALSPDDKLARLYKFCNTEIRRIDDDAADSESQRPATLTKQNKTAADTLKQKAGTGQDIDFLFAALASAAGFMARFVQVADREQSFFNTRYPTSYLLTSYNIAVDVNNQWRFFDPAGRYLPYGMLRWQEEGLPALIGGVLGTQFVETPISSAERSLIKRSATLRLEPDGTLDGDVRMIFFGHIAAAEKEDLDGLTAKERDEYIQDFVKQRIGSAEVSNIQILNLTNPDEPLVESYHVHVPGYALRAGKRVLLQPAFFQYGKKPRFSSNTRIHPIYFAYPWTEDDAVFIDLPLGFELDNADQPQPLFSTGDIVFHEMRIAITSDRKQLQYTRHFVFAKDKVILYPTAQYSMLKSIFDHLQERDTHAIALKETAGGNNYQ